MKEQNFIKTGGLFMVSALMILFIIKTILGLDMIIFGVMALLTIIAGGIYIYVFNQKLNKHVCKDCNIKQVIISKDRVNQEEFIRHGRFVFINTYEYKYHCNQCEKDTIISKRVKMK